MRPRHFEAEKDSSFRNPQTVMQLEAGRTRTEVIEFLNGIDHSVSALIRMALPGF